MLPAGYKDLFFFLYALDILFGTSDTDHICNIHPSIIYFEETDWVSVLHVNITNIFIPLLMTSNLN